jgi:hypothetical protein
MDVVNKATGTVAPVEDSKSKHGEFDVILSTNALDRDGDELHADEWKTPLPDKINFDSDHGMSVATCVGSGKPFINDSGQLQVRGTFASTPHGQAVRTLVKEGHIDSVSVAFTQNKNQKSGKPQRELLNGAFVAVPANPEAKVLEVKGRGSLMNPDDSNASNWNPDTMNAVADIVSGDDQSGSWQNDSLDSSGLAEHIRGIHEMATRIRDYAVRLGNGAPYSDPDATPIDLAPSNRSVYGAATKGVCDCSCEGCTERSTKSVPQPAASIEAPAIAAVPAGTDDVELLKAKAWADAFMLTSIDED